MPPGRVRRTTAAILLWALAALPLAAGAQADSEDSPSPLVTAAVLKARLAEVQQATDLTEEARERLIGLYRRSLGNLEMAQAHRAAAAAYRGTAESAPDQIEALRAARAEIAAEDSVAELDLDPVSPLPLLQRRLQEDRADLAARQQAAELAGAEAERIRRETAGMDPALIRLSEANAELPRDLGSVTAALRELDQARARAKRLHRQIDADNRDARDALESGEVSDDLGAVLIGRLNAIPDLGDVRKQRKKRRLRMAQYQTRLLQQRAEARRLGDIETKVASLRAEIGRAPTQVEEDWLRQLLTQRLALLEQTIEPQALYLAEATELDAAEDALLATGAGRSTGRYPTRSPASFWWSVSPTAAMWSRRRRS